MTTISGQSLPVCQQAETAWPHRTTGFSKWAKVRARPVKVPLPVMPPRADHLFAWTARGSQTAPNQVQAKGPPQPSTSQEPWCWDNTDPLPSSGRHEGLKPHLAIKKITVNTPNCYFFFFFFFFFSFFWPLLWHMEGSRVGGESGL